MVYLNVLHPLVRQAALHLQQSGSVQGQSGFIQARWYLLGHILFALYQWRKVGVVSDDTFVAVTLDPTLDGAVISMLEMAVDAPDKATPNTTETERLDERHHDKWRTARANHMTENRDLVQHRQQSLRVSHLARCKLLEDQIDNATNEKIRRMKEGELSRANYGYERRVGELQSLADSADIHTTLVVEGSLQISRYTDQ